MQIGEGSIQALAGARVQLAERGVAVDQQDGVVGCGLGHGGEAAGRVLSSHKVRFYLGKKNGHLAAAKQTWVATVRGFADQEESPPADPKVSHAQPP